MTAEAMERLLRIMAALRTPETGCPWDLEQTFRTIAPYTLEEACEVADAIDREDMAALKDELGDLLFQVVFHARMAEEEGSFGFGDVVTAICEKMERRHPHVFGSATVAGAAEQSEAWEAHKARERAQAGDVRHSALDGVPASLPALMRAQKLSRRAARVGFDWPEWSGVADKVAEELGELRAVAGVDRDAAEEELGDLLFAAASLARHLDLDADAALRRANLKFEDRFRGIESTLRAAGRSPEDAGLDELEMLWNQEKARRPNS
jgi:MazG family protein